MPDDPKGYIIYHANCLDGFTSAWAAEKANPGYELVPIDPTGWIPEDVLEAAKPTIIVDVLPKLEDLDTLVQRAPSVQVFDHHRTTKGLLGEPDYLTYDEHKAACEIVWGAFHRWDRRPWALRLIADRDVWRFDHGLATKKANIFFTTIPMELENWDRLMAMTYEDILDAAEPLWQYVNERWRHTIRRAGFGIWEGMKTAFVNVEPIDCSEVADRLLKSNPDVDLVFAWFWRSLPDGGSIFQVSLRSRRADENIDVSRIAEKYGGGGHRSAAGFRIRELPIEAAKAGPRFE